MALIQKYDSDLKYAQWNPFFISLQKDIDQIKTINKSLRSDTQLLPLLFSHINALFHSTRVYSADPKSMEKRLSSIEKVLYSTKYLRDVKENVSSNKLILMQHKLIKALEKIYSELIETFSMNNLLPNVIKTLRKPKGRALLN